ncbi:Hypothetical predicted protein [Olea europaea subsp. europaea]|nr:Hypothetical predicted protein [Olea europaea subsp. europaea]
MDLTSIHQDNNSGKLGSQKFTKYDLVLAVKRQSPFFYQVSMPHMKNDRYLEGAVARYKGFLHIIRRNKERFIKSFSVPTYDIDLIWHTHQLHPASYCKDLIEIMGKVLEHDDTDSDRSKGQKLDTGFSGTTKQWEGMYGSRYWRAGGMYRGNAPSPVRMTPYSNDIGARKVAASYENQNLRDVKVLEVMLEFVSVRNLPVEHKGSLLVSFSKTQPDAIFNAKRSLTILSESGEKQVACFQCESTGQLLFELISCSTSSLLVSKTSKTMGSMSISLEDFQSPDSNLTVEKWLELVPFSNISDSKPICLRVAISVTVLTPAPYVLRMIRSQPFSKSSCLFPLPVRVQFAKSWTRVIDEGGNEIINLQVRYSKKSKSKKNNIRREVVGIPKSGETITLAEFVEKQWSLINSPWSLQLPCTNNDDGHLLELTGPRTVRLFLGGRLDYESKHCKKHKSEDERNLMTAVEFSAEDPYGRAVALIDLKYGTLKVKEEWFLLPGSLLAFMLGNVSRKEGYNSLTISGKSIKKEELTEEVDGFPAEANKMNLISGKKEDLEIKVTKMNSVTPIKGGGTSCAGCGGGGCGGGCGNAMRNEASAGCGAGCGGGCGGGCGNMAKCGGCGGGCGTKLANGGCGGCGGGGCGGGCGNKLANVTGASDGCINGQPKQAINQANEILVA